jgi:hypothetical protein
MLQRAGHSLDTATNGEEGVAMAGRWRYDLIVMDMSMPGIDGEANPPDPQLRESRRYPPGPGRGLYRQCHRGCSPARHAQRYGRFHHQTNRAPAVAGRPRADRSLSPCRRLSQPTRSVTCGMAGTSGLSPSVTKSIRKPANTPSGTATPGIWRNRSSKTNFSLCSGP